MLHVIIISIFVSIDKTKIIDGCRNIPSDYCNRMLIELIFRPESKKSHVEFLVNKVWKDKNLDISASKISVKQLIDRKAERFIETCLKLGMPLTRKDVEVAIHKLPIREQEIIKHLTLKFQENLDALCREAICSRKIPFIITLIQLGASLPSTSLRVYIDTIKDTLTTVLKQNDFQAARVLIEKFTEAVTEHFDLVSLMDSNIIKCPELIELLIEKGLNPNVRSRKTPISVVMSNQRLEWTKRIGIVCLLLKSGEHCYHLSLTSTSITTPLYVATEKALETGKNKTYYGHHNNIV